MTTEIEAEIAAFRAANDTLIAALIGDLTRLRESRDELLAAAKEAYENNMNDLHPNTQDMLKVAIANAEKLP